jgi:hypothetical protein
MAVKSTITHKLDIPHEPAQWIEIKELGWRTLESAREAKSRTAMLGLKDLGPEFFKSLTTAGEDAPKAAEAEEVLTDKYDMSILLRSSIVAWSYPEPCNEGNIDELDAKTANWVFEEIIKTHFPTKEAMGKVSSISNAPSAENPPSQQNG